MKQKARIFPIFYFPRGSGILQKEGGEEEEEEEELRGEMDSKGDFGSFSSIPDWDWEPTDQESIDAIEAAFSLAESHSSKRRRRDLRSVGRRLPDWRNPSANIAPAAGSPNSPIAKGENESIHFCNDDDARSSCPRNGISNFVLSPCPRMCLSFSSFFS